MTMRVRSLVILPRVGCGELIKMFIKLDLDTHVTDEENTRVFKFL